MELPRYEAVAGDVLGRPDLIGGALCGGVGAGSVMKVELGRTDW